MNIKRANTLIDEGVLHELYHDGFITPKFFTYYKIYTWIANQVTFRKISINQAVMEASEQFKTSERTIWRAYARFSEN